MISVIENVQYSMCYHLLWYLNVQLRSVDLSLQFYYPACTWCPIRLSVKVVTWVIYFSYYNLLNLFYPLDSLKLYQMRYQKQTDKQCEFPD